MNLFNTLTHRKDPFVPIAPPRVGIYVCGVTAYDDCHVGHARSAVVFDVLRRYLESRGYDVTFVKNFTDVDDKIIARAAAEHRPWDAVAAQYMEAHTRDMHRLGVGVPDVEPRATAHMPAMIQMIQTILERGYAYQVDGDVYYRVSAFARYGRLGRRRLEDLRAGARVDVDERKHDPLDFALWKAAKPGEPSWDSPWSMGRPGWHIECSAMAVQHLGDVFDIHGGGRDLTFPHHDNEIAQSCAATGQEFARYWVHNGFVTIDEEKMSKSLGNFFTVRDLFEHANCPEPVTAETLRYFLLSTQYRGDVNFSPPAVSEAKAALDNVYDLFVRLSESARPRADATANDATATVDAATTTADASCRHLVADFQRAFEDAMDDDLNTPKALAEFQRLRADINRVQRTGLSADARRDIRRVFQRCGAPLGLFQLNEADWVFRDLTFDVGHVRSPEEQECTDEWIQTQIQDRAHARARRDFAASDAIRDALAARGIILEDRPDGGTRWKR